MNKKFNLKTYQKISGDEHIEMRLRKQHEDEPNVINEVQLESYRATESDVLIEKQLEKTREDEAPAITERRLDERKASFDIEYRNPSAYEGDVNKLEEKRLQDNPVEEEKYESASIAPNKSKWWEDTKSPDGLKLAKVQKNIKQAQYDQELEEMDLGKERWEEVRLDDDGEDDNYSSEMSVTPPIDDSFDIIDEDSSISIIKEKFATDPVPSLYMVLEYNPVEYATPEGAKISALEKVLKEKPELAGIITEDDFRIKGEGELALSVFDDRLIDIIQQKSIEEETVGGFEDIEYEVKDAAGTPISIGVVKVNQDVNDLSRASILRDTVDFIESKHPEISLDTDSLNIDELETKGLIRYVVQPKEDIDNFSIEEIPEDLIEEPMVASNKDIVKISKVEANIEKMQDAVKKKIG